MTECGHRPIQAEVTDTLQPNLSQHDPLARIVSALDDAVARRVWAEAFGETPK